ncbi:class I SAM-dependent methyltransferase [Limnofasciculus baicalensis]|uniref:Class I SAM-dependent methyltransferase n=1 Tax=Limnofasciculus baicalensis BBK-W-15 TaxID=2699891 RepID=A0AAE3GWQ1_9CYAN|nr:class I SAM-dependent methyltransferase [Limnofasciculus baicalensis]MCP2732101.1 class I SAM-dependent methyltransferase [Limnofasciculus baicalensis BBK-W-15]
MFEQQPDTIREKVRQLAAAALENSQPSGWFEILYQEAKGDPTQVPWVKLTPHPYFQDWLKSYPPQPEGKLGLILGCGLGDDAEALAAKGFQVTAFDISPTAIAWCRERFPESGVNYLVADLFNLPREWEQKFDFVLECRNIQSLPLSVRSQIITEIAKAVAPEGTLLVITRLRDREPEGDSPPWALSNIELAQFQELGFQEIGRDVFYNNEPNSVKEVRIEYLRIGT